TQDLDTLEVVVGGAGAADGTGEGSLTTAIRSIVGGVAGGEAVDAEVIVGEVPFGSAGNQEHDRGDGLVGVLDRIRRAFPALGVKVAPGNVHFAAYRGDGGAPAVVRIQRPLLALNLDAQGRGDALGEVDGETATCQGYLGGACLHGSRGVIGAIRAGRILVQIETEQRHGVVVVVHRPSDAIGLSGCMRREILRHDGGGAALNGAVDARPRTALPVQWGVGPPAGGRSRIGAGGARISGAGARRATHARGARGRCR